MDQRRAQLRQVGARVVEDRVLQRGAQVGQLRAAVLLGDLAPVDAIGLEQPQQNRDGDRSFVVLQQVDVGRADAQSLRAIAPCVSPRSSRRRRRWGPMKVFCIPLHTFRICRIYNITKITNL